MTKREKIISLLMGYLLYILSMYLIISNTHWQVGVGVVIYSIAHTFMTDVVAKRKTR